MSQPQSTPRRLTPSTLLTAPTSGSMLETLVSLTFSTWWVSSQTIALVTSISRSPVRSSFQSPLKEAREYFEKEYLTTQLKKHHGNISKTADFIGMERSALHRKLKSLGIKGIN